MLKVYILDVLMNNCKQIQQLYKGVNFMDNMITKVTTAVPANKLNSEEQQKKYGFMVKTAKEIQDQKPAKNEFLIDGILTPGLNLLAGPRKQGKSWLALNMAINVAKGEKMWDRDTVQGDVLYMALEDNDDRINKRMSAILDDEDAPQNLQFTYEIAAKGGGISTGLEMYLKDNPNVKLVIIDVLQKIRGSKKSGQTEYEHDYAEMGALKKVADKSGITILVVTHTRKTKDEDWMNEIAGGVGVTGAADTILMISKEKDRKNNILHIAGRDVPRIDLEISFNKDKCIWEYLGTADELNIKRDEELYATSPIVKTIKMLIAKNGGSWYGTSRELLECGLQEMGESIAKSEAALARKVNRFDELFLKESIQHIKPNPNGGVYGRKHGFVQIDSLPPEIKCSSGESKSVSFLDIIDKAGVYYSFPEEEM